MKNNILTPLSYKQIRLQDYYLLVYEKKSGCAVDAPATLCFLITL